MVGFVEIDMMPRRNRSRSDPSQVSDRPPYILVVGGITPRISGRAAAKSQEYAWRWLVAPTGHNPMAAPCPLHANVSPLNVGHQ